MGLKPYLRCPMLQPSEEPSFLHEYRKYRKKRKRRLGDRGKRNGPKADGAKKDQVLSPRPVDLAGFVSQAQFFDFSLTGCIPAISFGIITLLPGSLTARMAWVVLAFVGDEQWGRKGGIYICCPTKGKLRLT